MGGQRITFQTSIGAPYETTGLQGSSTNHLASEMQTDYDERNRENGATHTTENFSRTHDTASSWSDFRLSPDQQTTTVTYFKIYSNQLTTWSRQVSVSDNRYIGDIESWKTVIQPEPTSSEHRTESARAKDPSGFIGGRQNTPRPHTTSSQRPAAPKNVDSRFFPTPTRISAQQQLEQLTTPTTAWSSSALSPDGETTTWSFYKYLQSNGSPSLWSRIATISDRRYIGEDGASTLSSVTSPRNLDQDTSTLNLDSQTHQAVYRTDRSEPKQTTIRQKLNGYQPTRRKGCFSLWWKSEFSPDNHTTTLKYYTSHCDGVPAGITEIWTIFNNTRINTKPPASKTANIVTSTRFVTSQTPKKQKEASNNNDIDAEADDYGNKGKLFKMGKNKENDATKLPKTQTNLGPTKMPKKSRKENKSKTRTGKGLKKNRTMKVAASDLATQSYFESTTYLEQIKSPVSLKATVLSEPDGIPNGKSTLDFALLHHSMDLERNQAQATDSLSAENPDGNRFGDSSPPSSTNDQKSALLQQKTEAEGPEESSNFYHRFATSAVENRGKDLMPNFKSNPSVDSVETTTPVKDSKAPSWTDNSNLGSSSIISKIIDTENLGSNRAISQNTAQETPPVISRETDEGSVLDDHRTEKAPDDFGQYSDHTSTFDHGRVSKGEHPITRQMSISALEMTSTVLGTANSASKITAPPADNDATEPFHDLNGADAKFPYEVLDATDHHSVKLAGFDEKLQPTKTVPDPNVNSIAQSDLDTKSVAHLSMETISAPNDEHYDSRKNDTVAQYGNNSPGNSASEEVNGPRGLPVSKENYTQDVGLAANQSRDRNEIMIDSIPVSKIQKSNNDDEQAVSTEIGKDLLATHGFASNHDAEPKENISKKPSAESDFDEKIDGSKNHSAEDDDWIAPSDDSASLNDPTDRGSGMDDDETDSGYASNDKNSPNQTPEAESDNPAETHNDYQDRDGSRIHAEEVGMASTDNSASANSPTDRGSGIDDDETASGYASNNENSPNQTPGTEYEADNPAATQNDHQGSDGSRIHADAVETASTDDSASENGPTDRRSGIDDETESGYALNNENSLNQTPRTEYEADNPAATQNDYQDSDGSGNHAEEVRMASTDNSASANSPTDRGSGINDAETESGYSSNNETAPNQTSGTEYKADNPAATQNDYQDSDSSENHGEEVEMTSTEDSASANSPTDRGSGIDDHETESGYTSNNENSPNRTPGTESEADNPAETQNDYQDSEGSGNYAEEVEMASTEDSASANSQTDPGSAINDDETETGYESNNENSPNETPEAESEADNPAETLNDYQNNDVSGSYPEEVIDGLNLTNHYASENRPTNIGSGVIAEAEDGAIKKVPEQSGPNSMIEGDSESETDGQSPEQGLNVEYMLPGRIEVEDTRDLGTELHEALRAREFETDHENSRQRRRNNTETRDLNFMLQKASGNSDKEEPDEGEIQNGTEKGGLPEKDRIYSHESYIETQEAKTGSKVELGDQGAELGTIVIDTDAESSRDLGTLRHSTDNLGTIREGDLGKVENDRNRVMSEDDGSERQSEARIDQGDINQKTSHSGIDGIISQAGTPDKSHNLLSNVVFEMDPTKAKEPHEPQANSLGSNKDSASDNHVNESGVESDDGGAKDDGAKHHLNDDNSRGRVREDDKDPDFEKAKSDQDLAPAHDRPPTNDNDFRHYLGSENKGEIQELAQKTDSTEQDLSNEKSSDSGVSHGGNDFIVSNSKHINEQKDLSSSRHSSSSNPNSETSPSSESTQTQGTEYFGNPTDRDSENSRATYETAAKRLKKPHKGETESIARKDNQDAESQEIEFEVGESTLRAVSDANGEIGRENGSGDAQYRESENQASVQGLKNDRNIESESGPHGDAVEHGKTHGRPIFQKDENRERQPKKDELPQHKVEVDEQSKVLVDEESNILADTDQRSHAGHLDDTDDHVLDRKDIAGALDSSSVSKNQPKENHLADRVGADRGQVVADRDDRDNLIPLFNGMKNSFEFDYEANERSFETALDGDFRKNGDMDQKDENGDRGREILEEHDQTRVLASTSTDRWTGLNSDREESRDEGTDKNYAVHEKTSKTDDEEAGDNAGESIAWAKEYGNEMQGGPVGQRKHHDEDQTQYSYSSQTIAIDADEAERGTSIFSSSPEDHAVQTANRINREDSALSPGEVWDPLQKSNNVAFQQSELLPTKTIPSTPIPINANENSRPTESNSQKQFPVTSAFVLTTRIMASDTASLTAGNPSNWVISERPDETTRPEYTAKILDGAPRFSTLPQEKSLRRINLDSTSTTDTSNSLGKHGEHDFESASDQAAAKRSVNRPVVHRATFSDPEMLHSGLSNVEMLSATENGSHASGETAPESEKTGTWHPDVQSKYEEYVSIPSSSSASNLRDPQEMPRDLPVIDEKEHNSSRKSSLSEGQAMATKFPTETMEGIGTASTSRMPDVGTEISILQLVSKGTVDRNSVEVPYSSTVSNFPSRTQRSDHLPSISSLMHHEKGEKFRSAETRQHGKSSSEPSLAESEPTPQVQNADNSSLYEIERRDRLTGGSGEKKERILPIVLPTRTDKLGIKADLQPSNQNFEDDRSRWQFKGSSQKNPHNEFLATQSSDSVVQPGKKVPGTDKSLQDSIADFMGQSQEPTQDHTSMSNDIPRDTGNESPAAAHSPSRPSLATAAGYRTSDRQTRESLPTNQDSTLDVGIMNTTSRHDAQITVTYSAISAELPKMPIPAKSDAPNTMQQVHAYDFSRDGVNSTQAAAKMFPQTEISALAKSAMASLSPTTSVSPQRTNHGMDEISGFQESLRSGSNDILVQTSSASRKQPENGDNGISADSEREDEGHPKEFPFPVDPKLNGVSSSDQWVNDTRRPSAPDRNDSMDSLDALGTGKDEIKVAKAIFNPPQSSDSNRAPEGTTSHNVREEHEARLYQNRRERELLSASVRKENQNGDKDPGISEPKVSTENSEEYAVKASRDSFRERKSKSTGNESNVGCKEYPGTGDKQIRPDRHHSSDDAGEVYVGSDGKASSESFFEKKSTSKNPKSTVGCKDVEMPRESDFSEEANNDQGDVLVKESGAGPSASRLFVWTIVGIIGIQQVLI